MLRTILCLLAITMATIAQAQPPAIDEPPPAAPARKPQWQRTLPPAAMEKVEALNKHVRELDAAGKREETFLVAEELIALRREHLGDDHWQVVDAKQRLADARVVETQEKHKLLDEAKRLKEFAATQILERKFEEARRAATESLRIHRSLFGENHPQPASSLGIIALAYRRQGKYAEADPLFREVISINRATLGNNHPTTAESLNDLAVNLYSLEKFTEAAKIFQESLAILTETRGDADTKTSEVRRFLAMLYLWQKDYTAAELLMRNALAISRRMHGDIHEQTAEKLADLATFMRIQGNYPEAEILFREVLKTRRQLFGERKPIVAETMAELAQFAYLRRQFTQAEALYREVLSIVREAHGEEHEKTIDALAKIAVVHNAQGDYQQAESIYKEVVRLRRKVHGPRHSETADSLADLADVLRTQEKYPDAEGHLQESLAIHQEVYGERHSKTATSLRKLADVYSSRHKFAEAETLHRQSISILRERFGEKDLRVETGLIGLGQALLEQFKFEEAVPLFQEAAEIREQRLGPLHPDTAGMQFNLGSFYNAIKNYDEAEKYYSKALRTRREVLGESHPDTALTLNAVAELEIVRGRDAKCETALQACVTSFEGSRLLQLKSAERGVGTEKTNPYPLLAALSARLKKNVAAWNALEHDLARGLLDEIANRRGALAPAPEQQVLVARLLAIQERMLKLATQDKRSELEETEYRSLQAERRNADDALAKLGADLSRQEIASLAEIQSALPPTAAIVAWVNVRGRKSEYAANWACILKRLGEPTWVQLPGSGPGQEWTTADSELPGSLRAALASGASQEKIAPLLQRLHSQRFAPLQPHLGGIEQLYVIGVREMAGIPVETLTATHTVSYIPSGTYLARRRKTVQGPPNLLVLGDPVFEQPGVRRISTALPPGGLIVQQVLPGGAVAKADIRVGDVLVAYAGTKLQSFENLAQLIEAKGKEGAIRVQVWRQETDQVVDLEIAAGRLGAVIDKRPARETLAARLQTEKAFASRGGDWDELPGSQVEVTNLSQLFAGQTIRSLTRSEANEQTLDKLRSAGQLASFRYLHFATHGEANNIRAFDSRLILSQDQPKQSLPAAGEPLLDNLLSAAEVLEHWKLNADLVTLSACETALGRDAGGDGMLGFAQAFLLSGSRSVCLSFWKVDDTATALLMDRFYRNLLGKREDGAPPLGKAAALAEAKRWLRELSLEEATDRLGVLTEGVSRGSKKGRNILNKIPAADDTPREAKPYAHPRYWAAFILIGDPD